MKNVISDQDHIICLKCDLVQIRSCNLKYDLDQDQIKDQIILMEKITTFGTNFIFCLPS